MEGVRRSASGGFDVNLIFVLDSNHVASILDFYPPDTAPSVEQAFQRGRIH